jgi:hypothetical protein
MNEANYSEMKNEILSLQKRLLGMSEILSGNAEEHNPKSGSRLKRF